MSSHCATNTSIRISAATCGHFNVRFYITQIQVGLLIIIELAAIDDSKKQALQLKCRTINNIGHLNGRNFSAWNLPHRVIDALNFKSEVLYCCICQKRLLLQSIYKTVWHYKPFLTKLVLNLFLIKLKYQYKV